MGLPALFFACWGDMEKFEKLMAVIARVSPKVFVLL